MNEFFRCPPYAFGSFLLTLIYAIVMYVYFKTQDIKNLNDIKNAGMMSVSIVVIFSVLNLGWMLWGLWNLNRNPLCAPVGYNKNSKWWNVFGPDNLAKKAVEQEEAYY